jgi:hypothetical protein
VVQQIGRGPRPRNQSSRSKSVVVQGSRNRRGTLAAQELKGADAGAHTTGYGDSGRRGTPNPSHRKDQSGKKDRSKGGDWNCTRGKERKKTIRFDNQWNLGNFCELGIGYCGNL